MPRAAATTRTTCRFFKDAPVLDDDDFADSSESNEDEEDDEEDDEDDDDDDDWKDDEQVQRMAAFVTSRLFRAYLRMQSELNEAATTQTDDAALKVDEESLEEPDTERPVPLHHKEGDRIVALGDEFAAGDSRSVPIEKEAYGKPLDVVDDSGVSEKTSSSSVLDVPISEKEGGELGERPLPRHVKEGDRMVALSDEFSASDDDSAPSEKKGFGKPLDVVESGVPPLHTTETGSVEQLPVDDATIEEEEEGDGQPDERPLAMHRKEGDRMVALGDEFSSGDNESVPVEKEAFGKPLEVVKSDVPSTETTGVTDSVTEVAPAKVGELPSSAPTTDLETGIAEDAKASIDEPIVTGDDNDVRPAERAVTMHKKEGDRVVALKDEFSTGPEIPEVVSTTFGRPLQVVKSGLPPLSDHVETKTKISTKADVENDAEQTSEPARIRVDDNFQPKEDEVDIAELTEAVVESDAEQTSEPTLIRNDDKFQPKEDEVDNDAEQTSEPAVIRDDDKFQPKEDEVDNVPASEPITVEASKASAQSQQDPQLQSQGKTEREVPKESKRIKPKSTEELRLEEEAYRCLLDLGMVEKTPDPSDPDYDHSHDDEFCS